MHAQLIDLWGTLCMLRLASPRHVGDRQERVSVQAGRVWRLPWRLSISPSATSDPGLLANESQAPVVIVHSTHIRLTDRPRRPPSRAAPDNLRLDPADVLGYSDAYVPFGAAQTGATASLCSAVMSHPRRALRRLCVPVAR